LPWPTGSIYGYEGLSGRPSGTRDGEQNVVEFECNFPGQALADIEHFFQTNPNFRKFLRRKKLKRFKCASFDLRASASPFK
jgi:hypothetical protein